MIICYWFIIGSPISKFTFIGVYMHDTILCVCKVRWAALAVPAMTRMLFEPNVVGVVFSSHSCVHFRIQLQHVSKAFSISSATLRCLESAWGSTPASEFSKEAFYGKTYVYVFVSRVCYTSVSGKLLFVDHWPVHSWSSFLLGVGQEVWPFNHFLGLATS